MRKGLSLIIIASLSLCLGACSQEKKGKDRSQAKEMYDRICMLTEDYTDKLENAPDSADWASVCAEFEEKLDKITFSYPPDTDLLLTEGQNDTLNVLMQEYVKIRSMRIHGILHPQEEEEDSLTVDDSLKSADAPQETTGN